MATRITDVTGRAFSKEVRDEFNRRKGLEQTLDNSSELYQPYFILRKLNNLDKVLEPRRAEESDYSNDQFAKLGHVFDGGDNNIDYDFGLNAMEDTEYRGLLGITNVSIELRDFSFYATTVNFEINDITLFREFKNTWFTFGVPVEMEFGRYSPMGSISDADINPNKEKRTGVIVKFDYSLQENGRGVSGSFRIYSTTWLSVLREGNSDGKKIEAFRKNAKNIFQDYHNKKVEEYLRNNLEDFQSRGLGEIFEISNLVGRVSNFDINDYLLAYMREDIIKQTYTAIRGVPGQISELRSLKPPYIKDIPDDENLFKHPVDKRLLSTFTLDPEIYYSSAYYFLSFRAIEEIINNLYWQDTIKMNQIDGIELTGIEINNVKLKGRLKSIDFEDVLINPLGKIYNEKELTDDIYISIQKIFNLIENSSGAHSFITNLLSTVNDSTLGNVDLKRVINDIYDKGEITTKGITLYDNSSIKEDNEYTLFDIHNPSEKLESVSINTEISENIATMIFFQSYGTKNDGISEADDSGTEYIDAKDDHINRWVKESEDELYNFYYRGLEPSSLVLRSSLFRRLSPFHAERKLVDDPDRIKKYERQSREEIQRKKITAIRRYYENTYRNFSRTLRNVRNEQAGLLTSRRISNSKFYNISLLEYTYYKLYLEISSKKQQYELTRSGNNLKQIPLTVSFDVDGITGILPTQGFKIKFESFPMQYNIDQKEVTFVVNTLNHTFQGNMWTTSIGGIMYINPSDISDGRILKKINDMEQQLKELEKVFMAELRDLVDEDEETIHFFKDKIGLDQW